MIYKLKLGKTNIRITVMSIVLSFKSEDFRLL